MVGTRPLVNGHSCATLAAELTEGTLACRTDCRGYDFWERTCPSPAQSPPRAEHRVYLMAMTLNQAVMSGVA